MAMAFGYQGVETENRSLSSMPKLFDNGFNEEFPSQFDDYFSDNFGLRSHFISANSWIYKNLLADSPNEKIIVGKKGYLFFDSTMDDYLGENILSKQEIGKTTENLLELQNYVQGYGGTFVLLIAPNKNSIYPEYMPKNYVMSEDNNYSNLLSAVNAAGINSIDMKEIFEAEKGNVDLYHKLDTHWNNIGAWIAYSEVMDRAGVSYSQFENPKFTLEQNYSGDLEKINMPIGYRLDYQYTMDFEKNYTTRKTIVSPRQMNIITTSEVNDSSILIFRDSFGDALYPFFVNSFGSAYLTTVVPYDIEYIALNQPDIVVIEITERNIDLLNSHIQNIDLD